MVSVEKYIAPPTTTGPAWSAATSGSVYVQTWASDATFDRLISASGEKRSPASVRLYDGQSFAATRDAGAATGDTTNRAHPASARSPPTNVSRQRGMTFICI